MAYPPAPQYPQQPLPEGPRTRPTVVSAVVWTQFLTAAVLVASGIASLSVVGVTVRESMKALEGDPSLTGTDLSGIEDIIRFGAYIGVAAYVVFAVFYLVLGLLVNRGNRPGRILSWILSGIALACCGLGQLIGFAGGAMTAGQDQELNDEMTRAIEEATPMWATALNWVALFLFIVGSLVVIVLLATPAANEFFRKNESVAGPYPYGQQPYGQPPQPPYGQQPPQPPYGGQQPPAPPQV
ncbi:hypothetical protein [Glycomyces paridis]|uniref:Uncharacterized protein n=1 Tax=Glycomyces paridis TaxID=2126555 RepID=A0A4S8PP76_9ACTN|nr:hypothetical protein [Glycomyces paridis]THV31452.1 hypothetical protein E9998_03560 [Glycomyces paridis]